MVRKSLNTIMELTENQQKNIAKEIKEFYYESRGEEIGIIEQQQLMELFLTHLAPIIYNKALDDTVKWYKYQQETMESDFYLLYRD